MTEDNSSRSSQQTTTEGSQERNLEWRCLTCGKTAPPAGGKTYMDFIKHPCTGKRQIWLVDTATGEQLANNANKAVQLGLIRKVAGKGEKESPEPGQPDVSSDGLFSYAITLPADAFTLFNLAKFSGLEEDSDKPFDEWVWDCITARFRCDYKKQLVLAPVEEVKSGEAS